MKHPRCPTCKKPLDAGPTKWSPFCCERCKLVDLQKWLGGAYAIPGRPLDDDELPAPARRDDDA